MSPIGDLGENQPEGYLNTPSLNYAKAYVWLNLAAGRGDRNAVDVKDSLGKEG